MKQSWFVNLAITFYWHNYMEPYYYSKTKINLQVG